MRIRFLNLPLLLAVVLGGCPMLLMGTLGVAARTPVAARASNRVSSALRRGPPTVGLSRARRITIYEGLRQRRSQRQLQQRQQQQQQQQQRQSARSVSVQRQALQLQRAPARASQAEPARLLQQAPARAAYPAVARESMKAAVKRELANFYAEHGKGRATRVPEELQRQAVRAWSLETGGETQGTRKAFAKEIGVNKRTFDSWTMAHHGYEPRRARPRSSREWDGVVREWVQSGKRPEDFARQDMEGSADALRKQVKNRGIHWNRRPRERSASERTDHVNRMKSEGISQSEYSRQNNIPYSSLSRWKREAEGQAERESE